MSIGGCISRRIAVAVFGIYCLAGAAGCGNSRSTGPGKEAPFEFVVVSDVEAAADEDYLSSPKHFPGMCQAIREAGKGSFLVAAGDISPPRLVDKMISTTLGDDYPWYFVVGNHDAKEKHLSWMKARTDHLPGLVSHGPKNSEQTTYSFNYGGVHFVVLNLYYSGLSDDEEWADVCPSLYDWLAKDLAAHSRMRIIVFGHEPITSVPDVDNGMRSHETTNLGRNEKNGDRFWDLLRERRVSAYICGHTDTFSWAKLNGVWQVNCGHGRGPLQDETRATFLRFLVRDDELRVQAYRSDYEGEAYRLEWTVTLD